MESLFNVVSKFLPLLAFYPRWAQLLFVVTFGLSLSSIAVFVVTYPVASKRKQADEIVAAEEKLSADALRDIDANLKDVDSLFSDLGLALSSYYTAATALRLNLLTHTTAHPAVKTYLEKPLTQSLRRDAEDTIAKLAGIRAALSAVQRSRFSISCWSRAAHSIQRGALARVHDSLKSHGFSELEATIDVADISSIQQFIAAAERRLGELTFGPVVAAVLATNSADIPAVGKGYDHAALRTLVFAGNLIFSFVIPSRKTPGVSLVASWGTAMLFDMQACLPGSEVVRAELTERHKGAAKAVASLTIDLHARHSVSADVQSAMSELENRFGLLFLELPS